MKGAKDFFYVLAKIAESAKKNIGFFGVSMGPAAEEKRIKIKCHRIKKEKHINTRL